MLSGQELADPVLMRIHQNIVGGSHGFHTRHCQSLNRNLCSLYSGKGYVRTIGQRSGWAWVVLVGALAVANMVIHRLLGSTINPPFFTALWFGITLSGLTPKESPTVAPWYKRAIYAVVVGTVIGWASYAEVASVR